jgi:hypothetical protein
MKNILLGVMKIAFTVLPVFNLSCNKNSDNDFCKKDRIVYTNVAAKEGMIVHSGKYNRFAVSLTVADSNNIDSQVIGFVCSLNSDLQTVGLKVLVTGTLKKFNTDENITPEIAGQNLYYFETTQIIKK